MAMQCTPNNQEMVYCQVCEHTGKRQVEIMGVERELPCYACAGHGKFITQRNEGKKWWEVEPPWFTMLYNYEVALATER